MVITECLPILIYDGLLTLDCDLGIYSDESLRDIYFEFIMLVTPKKSEKKLILYPVVALIHLLNIEKAF